MQFGSRARIPAGVTESLAHRCGSASKLVFCRWTRQTNSRERCHRSCHALGMERRETSLKHEASSGLLPATVPAVAAALALNGCGPTEPDPLPRTPPLPMSAA